MTTRAQADLRRDYPAQISQPRGGENPHERAIWVMLSTDDMI